MHGVIEPVSRIAQRPGVAFLCLWSGVLNATATSPLSPALPSIAAELGGGVDGSFVAQMVQSVSAIGMILGATIAGYGSERFGRRAVMMASALLFIVAGMAGLVLANLTALIVSRALTGLASGAMLATSYAIAGENFVGDARNRILGFCGGAGAFATLLLLGVAGYMVEGLGWRSVFSLYALGFVILPVLLRSLHPGASVRTTRSGLGWGPILRLWPLWLLQIGFSIGVFMSVVQVPFIAASKGIVDAKTISLLVATTSVSGTGIAIAYGFLRRFLDVRGMLSFIALAFGSGLLVCAFAASLPMFLLGTMILGFGAGSLEPTIISRAFQDTPEPLHDRAAGTSISTLFLGQFLNPIAVYPMAATGGIGFAAITFGCIYLLAAVPFLLPRGGGRFAFRDGSGSH